MAATVEPSRRCCTVRERDGSVGWWCGGGSTVNLVVRAARPTSIYLCAARRGPPAKRAGKRPRSGRMSQGPGPVRWDQDRREINSNILPLDLTLYSLLSFSFTFTRFIIDLCIEHASSSRSLADRLNSYNARLHSETDSVILLGLKVQRYYRLYHNPMLATCPMNTLGGKPFFYGSASILSMLTCSRLIT